SRLFSCARRPRNGGCTIPRRGRVRGKSSKSTGNIWHSPEGYGLGGLDELSCLHLPGTAGASLPQKAGQCSRNDLEKLPLTCERSEMVEPRLRRGLPSAWSTRARSSF